MDTQADIAHIAATKSEKTSNDNGKTSNVNSMPPPAKPKSPPPSKDLHPAASDSGDESAEHREVPFIRAGSDATSQVGPQNWGAPAYQAAGAAAAVGFAFGLWWLWARIPRSGNEALPQLAGQSSGEARQFDMTPERTSPVEMSIATPPELSPEMTGPKMSAAAAAALSSRAQESVFENTPEQPQTWDMNASVRGVSGKVQDRVGFFDKK